MIPYEELCAALQRYAEAQRGDAPAPSVEAQPDSFASSSAEGEEATQMATDQEIDLGDVLTDEER
jgi:hypothetical protein